MFIRDKETERRKWDGGKTGGRGGDGKPRQRKQNAEGLDLLVLGLKIFTITTARQGCELSVSPALKV